MILTSDKSRLIQLSFLMLFVELAIIRWTGANIYALSFFSNFILLASFLGIGIGFIRPKSSMNIFPFAPLALALFILLTHLYSYEYQIQINPLTDDLNFWSIYFKNNLFPVELTLPIIFIAVTIVMATIADGVARTFQTFAPLIAYRFEIIGSILGVVCFSFLSFLNTSPLWWGIIISLLFISLLIRKWRLTSVLMVLQIASLCLLVITFHKQTASSQHQWSPYYKIDTKPYSHGRYAIIVNGWPQQFIESVSQRKQYKPFYFMPYQHIPEHTVLNNVLVVGAGTGGDVAIALAKGAKHVDAVEIDPLLYRLGKEINPNQPYNNPRVHVYINDGRSFLQQSKTNYDMIIFALPDSLMVLSGLSSLRLENYLFTLEGIETVQKHLSPDGVFTMYNYYRERWLIDRLANTLSMAFNHTPCFDTYGKANQWLSVLTISKSPSSLQCKTPWVADSNQYSSPSTDDHPFMYLKENSISAFYITALLFMFIISVSALKIAGGSYRPIKSYLDLFFMGTAFLLLESKSIVTFALLFGSTWFVNALVFIGILFTVYLAIEVTHRIKYFQPFMLYGALFISLLLAWIIPNHYLLFLPPYLRFISATALTFLPIFIANLIFSDRFRRTAHSTEAFGANLIGAVLGGLLEYASLIVGFRSLLILIAGLYMLAILLMKLSEGYHKPVVFE